MGLSACSCLSLRNSRWGAAVRKKKKEKERSECRSWHAAVSLTWIRFGLASLQLLLLLFVILLQVQHGINHSLICPAVWICFFFPNWVTFRFISEYYECSSLSVSVLVHKHVDEWHADSTYWQRQHWKAYSRLHSAPPTCMHTYSGVFIHPRTYDI